MRFVVTPGLLLLLLVLALQLAESRILGVPDAKQQLYQASNGKFKCLDGSSEVSFSAINDDYCDCGDGSDEPGTSACPQSQFTCQNLEYLPVDIPASWVGDGICDCCDGSDEKKISCPNTCSQKGAEARAEALKIHNAQAVGWQKRSEYVRQAGEESQKRLNTIKELKLKLAGLEEELMKLTEEKEQAEEKERLAVERQRQKEQVPLSKQVEIFCSDFKNNLKGLNEEVARLRDLISTLRETSADKSILSSLDEAITRADSVLSKTPTVPDFCNTIEAAPSQGETTSSEPHDHHDHDHDHDHDHGEDDHDDDHYHDDEYIDDDHHDPEDLSVGQALPKAPVPSDVIDADIAEDDGEGDDDKKEDGWDFSALDALASTCSSMLQEYLCYFNLIDCTG